MSYSDRAKQVLDGLFDDDLNPAEILEHTKRYTGANGAPEDVNELFLKGFGQHLRNNTRKVAERETRRGFGSQLNDAADAAEAHLPPSVPRR